MKKEDSILLRRRLPIVASSPRVKRGKFVPTAKNPIMISASELRDFLRCRVKWAWRYPHQLQPREKPEALVMGSLGHEILPLYYNNPRKKRTVKAMERACDEILNATTPAQAPIEMIELLRAMCIGYAFWVKPQNDDLGIDEVKSELWFEEPLTSDRTIIVRGYLDQVFDVGSMRNTVGCFEHKFKRSIDFSAVELNLQVSVYLWALRRLFPKKKKYVAWYTILRKQMPGPRVKAALFARESIDRTDDEIEQWAIDAQHAALDMLDAAIYPNPIDSCAWDCDFQTPCLLRGRPSDVRHVLKTHYVRRER